MLLTIGKESFSLPPELAMSTQAVLAAGNGVVRGSEMVFLKGGARTR